MSSKKFFDLLKDEQSGGERPQGLSLNKILTEVGQELRHLGKQGAHEMAAALFNGSPFVMYPKAGQDSVDQPEHGLPEVERDTGREL